MAALRPTLALILTLGCGARTELRADAPDAAASDVTPPAPTGVRVAAGLRHACALRPDGTVVCWGANGEGQLGVPGAPSGPPVEVAGLSGVAELVAYADGTCAVTRDGRVLCWGGDAGAGLAPGSRRRTAPTEVPSLAGVRRVAMGLRVNVASLADGGARTWGDNANGCLGLGTYDSPLGVQTPVGLPRVAALAGGYEQLCAVTAEAQVWCWGPRLTDYAGRVAVLAPRVVPGVAGAREVALTVGSACALLADRTVSCWGYNREGTLGDGTTADRPLPATVRGLGDVAAITGGFGQFCALDRAGAVWCWGRNRDSECGVPGPLVVTTPTRVAGLPPTRQVSAGWEFTCAVTVDDAVYCWGDNGARQLGAHPSPESAAPVRVPLS